MFGIDCALAFKGYKRDEPNCNKCEETSGNPKKSIHRLPNQPIYNYYEVFRELIKQTITLVALFCSNRAQIYRFP